MSKALELLDQALELAGQEKAALEQEEYDLAMELAEKRSSLTDEAWGLREPQDNAGYAERLQALCNLQSQLTAVAMQAHAKVRQSLNRSKQEKKRMAGYHAAVGQALR